MSSNNKTYTYDPNFNGHTASTTTPLVVPPTGSEVQVLGYSEPNYSSSYLRKYEVSWSWFYHPPEVITEITNDVRSHGTLYEDSADRESEHEIAEELMSLTEETYVETESGGAVRRYVTCPLRASADLIGLRIGNDGTVERASLVEIKDKTKGGEVYTYQHPDGPYVGEQKLDKLVRACDRLRDVGFPMHAFVVWRYTDALAVAHLHDGQRQNERLLASAIHDPVGSRKDRLDYRSPRLTIGWRELKKYSR